MTLENLFLVLNLGCEMVYVIDQRLMAQKVAADKSAQVLRELTEVLLDHKFLNYVTMHFEHRMLSIHQARSLLSDIASCSLMRLDQNSMDKLWELMIMLFKWQLSIAQAPQNLMDITFRHLDGVARIMPDLKKSIRVDATKQILIDYWDNINEGARGHIINNIKAWLRPFNTKISILIRLSLQNMDGSFVEHPKDNGFYDYYCENLGTNVYAKTAHLVRKDMEKPTCGTNKQEVASKPREFDMLSDQLGFAGCGGGVGATVSTTGASGPLMPSGQLNLSDMLGMVSFDILDKKLAENNSSASFAVPTVKDQTKIDEDLGDLV